MSTRPNPRPAVGCPVPVTPARLAAKKRAGDKIVMVTAYDFPGALAADEAGVDIVLVGDSAAMTVLGYRDTTQVSVDEMVMLSSAVRRGLRTALLVSDLPFGSYEDSDAQAVETARRFVDEAGADAVKLERGDASSLSRARAIVAAGIPVMGHVGLTPQTAAELGGFKAQGRTAESARRVADEALALQSAGCFSVVFEAIPAAVSEAVMPLLDAAARDATHPSPGAGVDPNLLPIGAVVIGIGAGPATDGQVLVMHDLLGMSSGGAARFVKRYADLHTATVEGLARFAGEVRDGTYPGPEHCYGIPADELVAFRSTLPHSD